LVSPYITPWRLRTAVVQRRKEMAYIFDEVVELTEAEICAVSGGGSGQTGLVNVNDSFNHNSILNNDLNKNDVNVAVGVGSLIIQKA
jgi:hypothetical protein